MQKRVANLVLHEASAEIFPHLHDMCKMCCNKVATGLMPMQVMDKHLQILAQQHMETKFVKVDSPHHSHQCIKLRRNPNRQCFSHLLHIKLPRFYCGAAQLLCQNLIQPCAQIHAEKSPYLVEKLKIWMLPTLALIRQEKTVDYVVGFDDLGSKDDFTTEVHTLYPPCNHRRVILYSKGALMQPVL